MMTQSGGLEEKPAASHLSGCQSCRERPVLCGSVPLVFTLEFRKILIFLFSCLLSWIGPHLQVTGRKQRSLRPSELC